MTAIRSRCSTRLRKVSRSLVERSAQCMSSSTSSTGVVSASSASMPSTAPNSCCCAMPGTSPPAGSALFRSGNSNPSTGRAASASASAGVVCAALRSASASGRYGTLSPSSAHRPDNTMNPRAAATVASSATSRVLPMPASPLTRATMGSSVTARSSTRVRRPNSPSLPTSLVAGACSMTQVSQVVTTNGAARGPRWRAGAQGLPSPSVQDADLASAAEELYALSPGDFTAARDERAAQARAAGDRDLALAIGGLRRPVVSAWLVNQLAREAKDQVAELVALGESLRQAQQDLAGERVRELSAQRRTLVAALVAEAKRIAARDGRPAGLQVEREVDATLQAALADSGAAAAVQAGCLASPLSYAGLGVGDAASVATRGRRAPAAAPARDKAERKPARRAPAGGKRETPAEREARRAVEQAEREARQAAAEAERRANKIAEAQLAVSQATETLADATAALDQAEQKVISARAAQESARQQVERLDQELSLAVAEESRANRAVRDAQRGKEAAARAADTAKRQLARAEAAARRLD